METLKSARALYDLGLAVHWLRPKSKIPLFPGWNNLPKRVPWEALEKTYQVGLNVGVRLGAPSEIMVDGKRWYLAVIDCDVKSKEPRHRAEMQARLRAEFGELLAEGPRVGTGRGNGSAHFYARTEKPVAERRVGQSSEKIKVKMPSAKPSAAEIAALTPDKITAGWRLRTAWEITVMGNSRQVAAPPSIHPDSGEPYRWVIPVPSAAGLPVLSALDESARGSGGAKRLDASKAAFSGSRFVPVEVDLVSKKVAAKTIALIERGDGCSGDLSASMFSAALSLSRAGLTDDEIISVLIDPNHHWAGVAERHAQTDDVTRAAHWVREYTVNKARRTTAAETDFRDAVVISDLPDDEAEKQKAEINAEREANWADLVERAGKPGDNGPPKNTLKNVITIFNGAVGAGLFCRNEFTTFEVYGRKAPWGGKRGEEITDAHIALVRQWFGRHHRFEPTPNLIQEAITCIAHKHSFHPVRDYLDKLDWDGRPRADTWLKDYMGATGDDKYLRAVSRKILCAMVARAYKPGVKFDQVVVLEGTQGIGKSTALRFLAGDSWFSDAHIDIKDKDGVLAIAGVWLSELGELSSLRKVDVDQLKDFISRTCDRVRKPYGKRTESFPRQGVFIGTTNNDDYLKDATGNRRFWPVAVGACDFDRIRRDRDQLFAEAKFLYCDLDEPLYIEDPATLREAEKAQHARLYSDPWEDTLVDFFDVQTKLPAKDRRFPVDSFSLNDIFHKEWGPLKEHGMNSPNAIHRATASLKKLGFKSKQIKNSGRNLRRWTR